MGYYSCKADGPLIRLTGRHFNLKTETSVIKVLNNTASYAGITSVFYTELRLSSILVGNPG